MRTKGLLAILLIVVLLFTSCSVSEPKEIACEDVIAAYEAADYEVWHDDYETDDEQSRVCQIRATHPDGKYIFFTFYDSEDSAETYAKEHKWNMLTWLFSVIYGDSTWITTKTYGNIEIEYGEDHLYEPFEELTK